MYDKIEYNVHIALNVRICMETAIKKITFAYIAATNIIRSKHCLSLCNISVIYLSTVYGPWSIHGLLCG